jgi:hypothetical protein
MNLFEQLNELSQRSANELIDVIINDHSKFIETVSENLTALRSEISGQNDAQIVRTQMKKTFCQIKDLCTNELESDRTFNLDDANSSFETQIKEFLENSDKEIKSQFSVEILRSDVGKTFFFKLWKPFKLLGSKIIKPKKMSFETDGFVESFWTLPFLKDLYEIRVDIYKKIISDLNDIHEKMEIFQDISMFFDRFNEVFSEINKNDMETTIKELDETIEFINNISKSTTELTTEKDEKIKALSRKIEEDMSQKIKYAGTMIVPRSSFSIESNKIKREKEMGKCISSCEKWKKYFDFCISSWHKDLELSELQFNTALTGLEITNMINSRHEEKIDPALNSIRDLVIKSKAEIVELKKGEGSELKKAIMLQNRSITKTLRSELLPKLLESIRNTNYKNLTDLLLDKISQFTDNIKDSHTIITKQDLNSFSPLPHTDRIPTKTLIKNRIEQITHKKAATFLEKIKTDQEKLLRRINDIDTIINSNFEASLNILRENEGEPLKSIEVAAEGLERTGILVEELSVEFENIRASATEFCIGITSEMINKTEDFSIDEKVLNLKMLLMREQTFKKMKASFSKAFLFIKHGWDKAVTVITETFSRSKKQISSIRKITGLSAGTDSVGFGFTQYLNNSIKKIEKLPYVYQRLFRMEPLTGEDLFAARKTELNTIKQDYLLWKDGAVASIALFGEKGSGKTTLLNIARNTFLTSSRTVNIELSGTISKSEDLFEILRGSFGLEDVKSFDELESKLLEGNSRFVCIVENIENIYLRTVDGFEAIERFLLLISKTHSNIFWIVSSSLYAYLYLDYVIEIKKHFQRSVLLGPLSENEVEDIILARHFSSGYSLIFKETGTPKTQHRKMRDEKEKQISLRKEYFAELSRISDGNIYNSIILWLNAIIKVEDEKIIVGSNIVSEYAFISQLPKETLFTLAAIIQHDSITVENFMLIFRNSRIVAEKTLERLATSGILQKTGESYNIHPFLFKSVAKVLKQNNILH